MTKNQSNGAVTGLSNQGRYPLLTLHLVLLRVAAWEALHHSGGSGHVQGFDWANGRMFPEEQVALSDALDAGLITICAPAVEGADPSRDVPRWLRLIDLGVPTVKGNPVAIAAAGLARLAVLNASAVLVGAA